MIQKHSSVFRFSLFTILLHFFSLSSPILSVKSKTMNRHENDSSKNKKQKQKQGTLDRFVYAQKKTNSQVASSSAPPVGSSTSTQTKNDLNNKTQQTEMGTISDDADLITELQFGKNESQFDILMKIILYCSNNKEYRHPLVAPLFCIRFLLHKGVDINDRHFDGSSYNDVVGFLKMMSEYDDNINEDVIKNAPLVQVDLIKSCSNETTKAIVKDIGGDYFAILVDKDEDINHNESITLCLRYVDKSGDVVERFLGIVSVMEPSALSLKDAIFSLLVKHSLSASSIRGQGYNALSNMKYNAHLFSDVSCVQTMIKKETQSAYYIHCFANHLQVTLFEISKESIDCVWWFFFILEDLLKVVIVSWKEDELPRENHFQKVTKAFEDFIIQYGRCLNPGVKLGRLDDDDTRFGPYYKLVLNVIDFYPVILEIVMHMLEKSDSFSLRFRDELGLRHLLSYDTLYTIENFDFVFLVHMMKTVLEVTNELSVVLQKKDENIVIAMSLLKSAKERLQILRDDGWETLLSSVIFFCNKNNIKVLNMEDMYIPPLRSIRNRDKQTTTNLHHFQVDVFFATVDLHLQELNSRFDEVNTELLVCMGILSPINSFCSFDKQKLLKLAALYPNDFSSADLHCLSNQLDNYICDVRKDKRFVGLKDVKELSKKLVEVKKHEVYHLVYLLIRLVLILPVATASVERAFSGLNFFTSELQAKVSDEFLNDRAVTYIEREVLSKISNDKIIKNFESMKTGRE